MNNTDLYICPNLLSWGEQDRRNGMSVKVFYLCNESLLAFWISGKEYELIESTVTNERGVKISSLNMDKYILTQHSGSALKFTRIERQTFELFDREWFAHKAGDSCPVDRDALVEVVLSDGTDGHGAELASEWAWMRTKDHDPESWEIIGWRYADRQKPVGKPQREEDDLADSCVAAMDWHAESEGERNYRLKQEAIRKAEKEVQEARDKRMRSDYDILSKDFTNKHDSKMGWKP